MTQSIITLALVITVLVGSIILTSVQGDSVPVDDIEKEEEERTTDYWMSVHPCDFEQTNGSVRWTNFFNNYLYRRSGQSSYMQAHVDFTHWHPRGIDRRVALRERTDAAHRVNRSSLPLGPLHCREDRHDLVPAGADRQ